MPPTVFLVVVDGDRVAGDFVTGIFDGIVEGAVGGTIVAGAEARGVGKSAARVGG